MKLRTVVIVALITVSGLLAGPASCVLIAMYERATRYDRESDDYRYVKSALASGLPSRSLDVQKINRGDWQFICVIGAYNDPVRILREEAARRRVPVASVDAVETQFWGLSPVEENESAISFVDGSGRGRTILIDGFEVLTGQHGKECFGPETREIILPRRES